MHTSRNTSTVLIVEDDKLFSLELERNLVALGYQVIDEVPRTTLDAWRLAEARRPHLTLIDIHLEAPEAGLLLADKLAKAGLPFLFMTSDQRDEVFDRAKRFYPDSYLIKPFGVKRLHRNVQLALDRHNIAATREEEKMLGKDRNGNSISIPVKDITVVEAIGNYCYFHVGGQRFSARGSLSSFLKKLPPVLFMQIHRRYAVALAHITNVNMAADLLTAGQREMHIGGKFRAEVKRRLKPGG